MTINDIEHMVYSGPITVGLDDNDLNAIMRDLKGLVIDIVEPRAGTIREASYFHSRVALKAQYSSSKVSIKLFGEVGDIAQVKSEFLASYKKLFKQDLVVI